MRTRITRLAMALLTFFSAAICLAEDAVKTAGMKVELKIDADYPVFNAPYKDNTIKAWLTAHTYVIMDNAKEMPDADIPETTLHVKIDCKTTDGPAGIVNVVFTTFYAPNLAAHPSKSLNTFVFPPEGEPHSLNSLFADPDRALRIFSEQAPKLLAANYKNKELDGLEDWIAEGTSPTLENYACYTVEPEGLRVYFREYQVAPYVMGMPDILIPLTALEPAGPNADVWTPMAVG